MAVKFGDFTARNGHEYVVEFDGDRVEYGEVKLSGATISMAAGEHKFNGFKSTTAVVNIITDKPLVDLYSSSPTDILLTVTDMTEGDVVFEGYVTPFAFDQAFTGKADTFTVNAVDLLSARKEAKYENIGEPYGTDRTAFDIVQAIAERAGVTKIVEHINFDTPTGNGTSPLAIQVAQAGFLQDEVGELDALSAICKFFGYTCTLVGYTLYLYDEHCLLNAASPNNAAVHEYRSGRWVMTDYHYNSEGTPLIPQTVAIGTDVRNDISVTIERAYDGIQITPEGSEVSVLLPEVCSDENMETNDNTLGTNTRVIQDRVQKADGNDIDYIQWRTPRRSKYMKTGLAAGNGQLSGDWSNVQADPMKEGATSWWLGTIPMRLTHSPRTRETINGQEIVQFTQGYDKDVIWARIMTPTDVVIAKQREDKRYSHTGGLVKLSLSWFTTANANWDNIDDKLTSELPGMIGFVAVVNGAKYFVSDYTYGSLAKWSDTPTSSLLVTKDGKTMPTIAALNRYKSDIIIQVPNDGQIYVELRASTPSYLLIAPMNIYIDGLSIEGYGDSLNLDDIDLRHVYNGGDELLEVRTMLTTRMSGYLGFPYEGKNARPAVVTDTEWNGGYMGRANAESIPISGILMEQLKARYAQPRICYKMTVDKNIKPYAAVYFGGKGYTVEAYDKDLYNSTTTITID